MESYVSDNELVRQFINGTPKAMDILINRHKKKVFNYIKHLVNDEMLAEDLFQDTFMKVIRSLLQGTYKDEGRFISWVMRIAHNLSIDYFRKSKNYREVSSQQGEVDLFNDSKYSDKNIEEEIQQVQIIGDLKKLIRDLPEEQRSIVVMRTQLDMSFKEIAEHTGVSINTALGRMRYALINMRKMMKEKDICLTVE